LEAIYTTAKLNKKTNIPGSRFRICLPELSFFILTRRRGLLKVIIIIISEIQQQTSKIYRILDNMSRPLICSLFIHIPPIKLAQLSYFNLNFFMTRHG